MKRFIKQTTEAGSIAFYVLDEFGQTVYLTEETVFQHKRLIALTTPEKTLISSIQYKSLVMRYFTIRCLSGYYLLLPLLNENFSFMVCGSSYTFAGEMSSGRFSMMNAEKMPVMTMKKVWSAFGEGFETEIFSESEEAFLLSSAICAATYLTLTEKARCPGLSTE